MSMYVNDYGEHVALPNTAAIEDVRSAKVTYRGPSGSRFRVIVRQVPNPIGFRARFPSTQTSAVLK